MFADCLNDMNILATPDAVAPGHWQVSAQLAMLRPDMMWANISKLFVEHLVVPADVYMLDRTTPPGSRVFEDSQRRLRMSITLADIQFFPYRFHPDSFTFALRPLIK